VALPSEAAPSGVDAGGRADDASVA
jgi:hypothetical protein